MSAVANGSTVDGITISHYEPLSRMTIERNGTAVRQKLSTMQSVDMRFDALGRTFDLALEPNSGLLDAAMRARVGDGVGIYRGRISGQANSWARLVFVDGVPRGLIWDGSELFAVEAPDDGILETSGAVIYRLADAIVTPGAMSCDVSGSSPSNGMAMYNKLADELRAIGQQKGPGAVDELNVSVVGDFEFTSDQGSNANAAIVTRLNNVDGIFSQQLAIQISVPVIETFSNAADPFTDTTVSGDLLDEVSTFRANNTAHRQQGLTHLYTGRNLNGSTAGVAYVDALCSAIFGVGLSEGIRGANLDSLVAAHEIGHNFGANHDGDPNGSCPNEPTTFIMASGVSSSNNTFGPCSIGIMQANAAQASCIIPLPSTDMTVSNSGQPSSVALGNAANVTFDVSNNGTMQATNVTADVALPGNVSLIAASASQGTCTSGASNVSCTLGSVAGSSATTVTLTASTDAVGPAVFTATVSSDVDDNMGNNQSVLQVNIDPAVNLVVTASSPQVVLNQSTTVSATLQNTSILDATGVTVTITLDGGLRADSATWSAGTCTVAAQRVDCTAATLGAQSTSSFSMGVTGLAAGTQGVTVTMASNETDANPANNTISATVNVTTGGGGGDDEGGGSVGSLFLLFLGSLVALRRSRFRT